MGTYIVLYSVCKHQYIMELDRKADFVFKLLRFRTRQNIGGQIMLN